MLGTVKIDPKVHRVKSPAAELVLPNEFVHREQHDK